MSAPSASASAVTAFLRRRRRTLLSAAAISLPVAVWVRDDMFSVHVVRGPSMEPALRDGDVVLVRRCEMFPVDVFPVRAVRRAMGWFRRTAGWDDGKERVLTPKEEEELRRDEKDLRMARRVERREQLDGGGSGWSSIPLLYSRALPFLPGDVVLFKSPVSFPVRYHVKRVVALGGQRVRPASRRRTVESVPASGLWVEGDNTEESGDSGRYGAVNRKLVLGKAERILWPPSRWGRVEKRRPAFGRSWWME